MRIHLQSKPSATNFVLSPEEWQQALARAPHGVTGHEMSFGQDREAFAAGMQDAEILVAHAASLAEGLPPAPKLKLVYATSAGLEKLAPYDWLPKGVALCNNRGTHAAKAGEYGLMALLMLVNRMPALMQAQREGRWEPLHGSVLKGRRLTVVGLGTLGGSAAAHAHVLGMQVTGVRTRAEAHPACDDVVAVDSIESVLPGSDYLYLATPLTAATRHILSRARIAMLPKGASVANVGRGGLIEQEAMLDALDSGHLGGAVIDVFDPEPLPPGHRAWTTKNLIVTPHVSADDPATYNARSLDIFLDNLRAYGEGRPLPNLYDIERGY